MDIHRKDYESLSSMVSWRLTTFSHAKTSWKGMNVRSGNRLFFVCAGEGTVRNVTESQFLELRPDHGYFMPLMLLLDFDFRDIELFCLHFQVEVMRGMDIFSGARKCVEFPLRHNEIQNVKAITEEEVSWNNYFRFEQFRAQQLMNLSGYVTFDFRRRYQLHDRYGKILDFMREKADAQTSVAELARIADVPQKQFCREFRDDFKMSVKEFLMREIFRRSEDMLLNTKSSIKEISNILNFGNEFYFSRFFKRFAELPPRDFRTRNVQM